VPRGLRGELSLALGVVGCEELHHQGDELTPLRGGQGFQNLLLDVVDDVVELQEPGDPRRSDGDDVAALVPGVDRPLDEPA
jgi:hypothetical protein